MGLESFLERKGVFKHKVTAKEMDEADRRRDELTVQFMRQQIGIDYYRKELDKLPKMDLRELASGLNGRRDLTPRQLQKVTKAAIKVLDRCFRVLSKNNQN